MDARATGNRQDDSSKIQALNANDIHRIASGQVILDLPTAVKELVENALDAGATSIEIRFKEYGLDSFEVVDNGVGIEKKNFGTLARKHHTSKLDTFEDLTTVDTFGFRGEALSSLCELSTVQMSTATQDEEPVGFIVEFDKNGNPSGHEKTVARQKGTSITITEMFSPLPVRRGEFERNIKKEFSKTQSMLQAYILITRGVRWLITNSVKGRRIPVSTSPASLGDRYLLDNVTSIFGPKSAPQLATLDLLLLVDADNHAGQKVRVKGLISRPTMGCGRSSSDRCFLFINGRPWDTIKFTRAFNEIYRQYNSQQYPFVIADFCVAGDAYDVNVSPDKRTLFLHKEGQVLGELKSALEQYFTSLLSTHEISRGTQSTLPFQKSVSHLSEEDPEGSGSEDLSGSDADPTQTPQDPTVTSLRRSRSYVASEISSDRGSKTRRLNSCSQPKNIVTESSSEHRQRAFTHIAAAPKVPPTGRRASTKTIDQKLRQTSRSSYATNSVGYSRSSNADVVSTSDEDQYIMEQAYDPAGNCASPMSERISSEEGDPNTIGSRGSVEPEVAPDSENPLSTPDGNVMEVGKVGSQSSHIPICLPFDLTSIRSQLIHSTTLCNSGSGKTKVDGRHMEQAAVGQGDAAVAEAVLTRTIGKEDFSQMDLVGQFNMGFILVRRRKSTAEDDMFIIDQHAADEKFNFETLTRTTRLQSQKLVVPRNVHLSPAEELVAVEHKAALSAHGFSVRFDQDAPPGLRIALEAIPMSQAVALGVDDLEELLNRLSDERPQGKQASIIRCSKVRGLLASRACRRSVMIGTALSRHKMRRIVDNLGTLDQPWNCPHGRPTMRHLCTLNQTIPSRNDEIAWQTLYQN